MNVYEAFEKIAPKIGPLWDAHSEIADGAARAGVVVAEAINTLQVDQQFGMKLVTAIMERPAFPNYRDGLIQWYRDLLTATRP